MLVLTVIQGPDKGRKFQLPSNEPQLIGRSSEALPLSDTTVSRRHAELTPDGGIWWIGDLQSQNGTYVNGVQITERTRLRPGDQIRVGSSLFVFGMTESNDPDVVRVLRPDQIDSSIEKTLPSNDDSVILSEPEPQRAAVHHLHVIYQLTTLTSQALDRQTLLKSVLDLVFEEFAPERGVIMLSGGAPAGTTPGAGLTPDTKLKPVVVKYLSAPRDPDEAQINVSRTILHHAVSGAEGVLCTNAMNDPRFAAGESVQRMHIRSAICSPIRAHGRTYGAIYIDSTIANYTYTAEQLALMNAIGQHTGLALANAELYAQKLQTERLAAMGETVASLSHSIKNILQGLRGGGDVVDLGLKKEDLKLVRNGWAILQRNLDRIMGLTTNMLAYSRQRPVEVQLVKIGPIIDEVAQLMSSQAEAKQAAVIVDVDPDMPPTPLDPELMHQALMNLVGNAVEAVDPGTGAVTIRAVFHPSGLAAMLPNNGPHAPGGRDDDDAVETKPEPRGIARRARESSAAGLTPELASGPVIELAVIDNGPGIPKDRVAWIFEPFNTTKGLRGTGLGLAVTKRIVEEHHGRIFVESHEGPRARGTTFRAFLPADVGKHIDPSATAGP